MAFNRIQSNGNIVLGKDSTYGKLLNDQTNSVALQKSIGWGRKRTGRDGKMKR